MYENVKKSHLTGANMTIHIEKTFPSKPAFLCVKPFSYLSAVRPQLQKQQFSCQSEANRRCVSMGGMGSQGHCRLILKGIGILWVAPVGCVMKPPITAAWQLQASSHFSRHIMYHVKQWEVSILKSIDSYWTTWCFHSSFMERQMHRFTLLLKVKKKHEIGATPTPTPSGP